jgi:16S rRNA (adenine1518-N6/adenine1519-N6)-dimethyltransferase
LRELNLAPTRRWGQNFLVDRSIFEQIATAVTHATSHPQILEIGPGLGGLTRTLLEHGAWVQAIEIDLRVKPALDRLSDEFPGRLGVRYGDALGVSGRDIITEAGFSTVDLAANLPYYVTAPILGRLMEWDIAWGRAVFMVQREVAERLLAHPGQRNSSALSVLMRYNLDVTCVVDVVSPQCFWPIPEVESSVIQLSRRAPLSVDRKVFSWLVRAGFRQRRKMLRQALASAPGSQWDRLGWVQLFSSIDIVPTARAEELTIEQWVRLADTVTLHKKDG